MDSKENYGSLDEQVQHTFRQRPKIGFSKRAVTYITLLATALTSCVRYDLHYVPSPDAIQPRVAAYQSSLDEVAERMGMYDSAANDYNTDKVKEEAEKQLKKETRTRNEKETTIYPVLAGYSIDEILATKKALDVLTENAKKAYNEEIEPILKKEKQDRYQGLSTLRNQYDVALKWYHAAKGTIGTDNVRRQNDWLAFEVLAFSDKDYDAWKKGVKKRNPLGNLEDSSKYEDVALWHPEEVRDAHEIFAQRAQARKEWWKKNSWWIICLGAYGIYSLTENEGSNGEGSGSNIGGEDGGPGGKGGIIFRF